MSNPHKWLFPDHERTCHCGSGERDRVIYDARGIPVGKACVQCEDKLRAKYKPEIFRDSQYECDERIDEDY